MTEIKRTREEAKRASNDKILELVWNNSYKCLFENTNCFEVQGDNLKIYKFPFTPPAPEFKKGTFGVFSAISNSGKPYEVIERLEKIENGRYYTKYGSHDNFTPIYQNDPILERAFDSLNVEYVRNKLDPQNEKTLKARAEINKDHYLSQAKKELSK